MNALHYKMWIATFLALTVIVIALSGGCGAKKNVLQTRPPAPVIVDTAVTMDVPVELRENGSIEAFNTVAITSRIGGQLLYVGFKEGQEVKKGEVLFRIDPGPFEAALSQAQANLERDQVMLTKAEADVRRYEGLVQKDYVTKQDYDAVVSTSAEAKEAVAADRALVENARLNLDYCTIRAPISGRTGNILIKQGNIVVANGPNPLVVIDQIVPIKVSFAAPEQTLSKVRQAAQKADPAVYAFLSSDSTRIFEGNLTFIDNAVDATTGTVLLKATFPNSDRALWPGQFVQVRLELSKQRNAVVIDDAAIQSSQQGDFVYVIGPGDSAQMRPVVAGPKYNGKVVIVKGVVPGEKVVTDGQFGLAPGAKVTFKTQSATVQREKDKKR